MGSKEIIDILQYLLPGFISAWIFYSLTSYRKPSQFERVVQALIFTVLIQALLSIFEKYCPVVYGKVPGLVWSLIVAVFVIGLPFSYFANNDLVHRLLRFFNITKETSYPTEWYGAFRNDRESPIILHLHDERRLYGWLKEWPSDPKLGHFVIAYPSWLQSEGESVKVVEVTNIESILMDVTEVKWIEFMELPLESRNV